MEYIQCPHCKKQYTVSDKLRVATGKKIRCKHCSQPFEIIVQTRSTEIQTEPTPPEQVQAPASEPLKTTDITDDLFDLSKYNSDSYLDSNESTMEQQSEKRTASADALQATTTKTLEEANQDVKKPIAKAKPAEKPFNIQLLFTIVLVITLLVTVVAVFLFQPNLFSTTSKQNIKSIETEGTFKPIEINTSGPTLEPIIKEKVKELVHIANPEPIHPRAKTPVTAPMTTRKQEPAKKLKPSQVCKDLSAEYWVRSNRLATASLDTKTYMRLLDQNLVQADEIRRACKDKKLVGIISKAARTGSRLDWFKHEINIVLDKTNADN